MQDCSFTIRDAREDERPAIADLTLRAYGEYATIMTPDAWAGLERALHAALASAGPIERVIAVRNDDTLVGSAMLFPAESNAYGDDAGATEGPEVRLVSVDPAMRGCGVARALMEECVRRARAAGAREMGVHTSVSMRAALRLYERMGFVRAPERDFQPPGAEIVQGYRLPLS